MSETGSDAPSRPASGLGGRLGAFPGAGLVRRLAGLVAPAQNDPLEAAERALAKRPDARIRFVGVPEEARSAVARALAPAELSYGLREPEKPVDFVAVAVWALPGEVRGAAALAAAQSAPLLFLRPSALALAAAPASFTLFPEPELDPERPGTAIERLLNGESEVADAAERAAARALIDSFATTARGAAPGGRPFVLIVDQPLMPIRDARALVSDMTFKRMIAFAAERTGCDVHVALSSHRRSYLKTPRLAAMLRARIAPERLTLHDGEAARETLLAHAETVLVATDDAGFRALMLGRAVAVFGAARFAGWGLTEDRIILPARGRTRPLEDLVHLELVRFGRHRAADGGPGGHEAYLPARQAALSGAARARSAAPVPPIKRLLVVLPGSRQGATARHVEILSRSLARRGVAVMALTEGRPGPDGDGVLWRPIEFAGRRMTSELRKAIVAFDPEVIHLFGSRTRPQRVALEAMVLTDAVLAVQVEDEDAFIYASQTRIAPDNLTRLDRPVVAPADVAAFMAGADWAHTLAALDDPEFDRWVEPLLRAICFRLAAGVTAIWSPLAERLGAEFGRPTMVLPPSVEPDAFSQATPTPQERAATLEKRGLDPQSLVFFTGGRTYGYSDAFRIFLRALNLLRQETGAALSLVVTGVEGEHALRAARDGLDPAIGFRDLGRSSDADYLAMLGACDVVCSPGADDPFDEYRLPSRLTRAMAWGKPVLTPASGFGRSLEHGLNAILTEGADPAAWAERMRSLLDAGRRAAIGAAARDFALRHFEAERVSGELAAFLADVAAKRRAGETGGGLAGIDLADAAAPRVPAGGACDFEVAFDVLTRRGVWSLGTVVLVGARRTADLTEWARFGARRMIVALADDASIDPSDYAADARVAFVDAEALRLAHALAPGETRLSLARVVEHIAADHGLGDREGAVLAALSCDPERLAFDLPPERAAERFEWAALAYPRAIAAALRPETQAFAASPAVVRETTEQTFGEDVVNDVFRLKSP